MRGFVIAIVVLLFALLGAQSSAQARTVVRAHVNAIAVFDPNVVDEATTRDAPASPRDAPQGSAVIDPADDRGAELRSREADEAAAPVIRSLRPAFARVYETAPPQALLGYDVPPPR